MTTPRTPNAPAPVWKRVIASILDFLTVFFGAGFVIARLSGQTTPNGFALNGGPALALFAVIVAYFLIGRRMAGGTLWDRILGIARPQPH
ncbi:MAG TPA: hypothetical protein PK970_11205 [Hyphomicrobiaceae bacterium]|nr:hypothetical protein [Hyphomicrobiaceae bacterium]